jgi:hypothetical protein
MLVDSTGSSVAAQDALLQSMPSDRAVDTTSLSLFSLATGQPVPPALTYTGMWLGSLLSRSAAVADPWESDGTEVHTCGEYVYKKFYDYERFAKRAAAQCGTDGMCVYRLATNSPLAIDGAGLSRTLYQNSIAHAPINPQVHGEVGLAYDMQAPAPANDQVAADEADARSALLAAVPALATILGNNPEFFVAAPKNPFFAYDVSFLRSSPRYAPNPDGSTSDYHTKVDDLISLVDSGRRYYAYSDEWKYHAARLAAQGDLTLAEREDIESRVHAYRAVVSRLKALVAARLNVQGDQMNQTDQVYQLMHNRVPGDPDPLAQVADSRWVDVPMSAALPATGMSAVIAAGAPATDPNAAANTPGASNTTPGASNTTPGGAVTSAGGVLSTPASVVASPATVVASTGSAATVSNVVSAPVSVATGGLQPIAAGSAAPSTTLSALRSPAGATWCIDPLSDACLYSAMDDVYSLLAAELNHLSLTDPTVRDQGCLDMNDARCDWSAKDFADQWLRLYKHDLESSYSSCIDSAGSDDLSSIAPQDRADVDALDAYFATKAALQAQVQAALGSYQLSAGQPGYDGTRVYGQTRTGGNSFGNPKSIAMDYSYSTYWYLTPSTDSQNGEPCRVDAEIGATFSAHAALLNQTPLELISTEHSISGHGGAPQIHSHLNVLQQQIYSVDADIPEIGGGDRADPSLCASDVFVILVVPVTVEACIAAHFGYDVHLGSQRTPAGQCDPNAIALHAGIQPWASTDVSGSIAVGVPGIEAGVRGDVEVLRMELQAHGEIGVDANANLNLETDARLDLNELSGKVELFAEALVTHAEKTLFEFPGLHETLPLWNLNKPVPLGGLVR